MCDDNWRQLDKVLADVLSSARIAMERQSGAGLREPVLKRSAAAAAPRESKAAIETGYRADRNAIRQTNGSLGPGQLKDPTPGTTRRVMLLDVAASMRGRALPSPFRGSPCLGARPRILAHDATRSMID